MSTKFFRLIFGDTIRIAQGKNKIIPADEFSLLLSAEEIINKLKKEAEQYKLEVASECEKIKEQARQEGFEEGFKQWSDHVANLEKEIKEVREETEKHILPVALKAAKKIVGREIELSDDTVLDIVSSTLKSVAQHKKIVIYTNKKDQDVLEKNRVKLKEIFENIESLSLRERPDLTPGSCVIETEAGIINANLENKWAVLEQAFQKMAKSMKIEKKDEE